MQLRVAVRVLALSVAVTLISAGRIGAQSAVPAWMATLGDIRQTAALMPGRRPLRINILKFAESRRTKNFSVKGAPVIPSVQARTAFQVMYADGYVMVDAGMDQQVHKFFGRGVEEPYDPAAAKEVERAVRGSKFIVVTHEHGDHVGGVIHTPLANDLAPKTILTRAQVQSLITSAQMPEVKLTEEMAGHYVVVDYDKYYPLAPGLAAVKAPGHTPGSQMIYAVLESGREYLLIGDAAWHMDGVREIKAKDAPWIVEDQDAVMAQLRWLNELSRSEKTLVIVASHDDEQHAELIKAKILGNRFE